MLQIFFALILAGSWGQALSNCTIGNGLPGPFSSAQAVLDAVNADQGTPFTETNEQMICRGRAIHMEFILGPPTEVNGFTSYEVMKDTTDGFCASVNGQSAHIVSTRRSIYNVGWSVYCSNSSHLHLSLNGSTGIRPAGTGGASTVILTAKVTESGTPKAGVAVSFSGDVTPNSGGHEHHDVDRPKGSLSGTQGTTDANGEVKLTFTAPEVAGIHTVKATCATCSNSPVAKEIQVKVPDLLPISPNPPQNTDGSYVYALTSVDKIHAGEGRHHKNQYYLTAQARQNLRTLIDSFSAADWGTVALNDASLYWGGRYDIKGNWGGPHQGHRDGREIDISFTRANNPISTSKQNDFYDKFCKDKAAEAAFSILHHFVKVPHFHVYLEKQKTCNRTEN